MAMHRTLTINTFSALSKLVTKVSSLRTTSERHRGQVMRFKQGLNEPFTVLKARKGPVSKGVNECYVVR